MEIGASEILSLISGKGMKSETKESKSDLQGLRISKRVVEVVTNHRFSKVLQHRQAQAPEDMCCTLRNTNSCFLCLSLVGICSSGISAVGRKRSLRSHDLSILKDGQVSPSGVFVLLNFSFFHVNPYCCRHAGFSVVEKLDSYLVREVWKQWNELLFSPRQGLPFY